MNLNKAIFTVSHVNQNDKNCINIYIQVTNNDCPLGGSLNNIQNQNIKI